MTLNSIFIFFPKKYFFPSVLKRCWNYNCNGVKTKECCNWKKIEDLEHI